MDAEKISALTRKIFTNRLYDSFFVHEYGKIEAMRASRYNSAFSVVLIKFEASPADTGEEASFDLLKNALKVILDSVRNCDVAGFSEDGRLMIILPETDYFGSLTAVRKMAKAAIAATQRERAGLPFIISQATFPRDGRVFGELLSAAGKRMAEKEDSVWERQGMREKLFWEIVGEMTGGNLKGRAEYACFDTGAGQELNEFYIDQINELIIRELARTPEKRGILYFASRSISAGLPLARALSSAGSLMARVFLVGESEGGLPEIKNATPVLIDDPRLREVVFTFFLNEDGGYGLICKENWGSTFSCFHTADPHLVEGLITKFQNEYALQEQLG